MFDLSFEYGMETVSWNAELALRRRVSMSAIGSVIDIGLLPFLVVVSLADLRRSAYQLDLVTPGSWPARAISRRQIRHRPNLRYTLCGRPQRWQRFWVRVEYFGSR